LHSGRKRRIVLLNRWIISKRRSATAMHENRTERTNGLDAEAAPLPESGLGRPEIGDMEACIAAITVAVQRRLREGEVAVTEWRNMLFEQLVEQEMLPESLEVAAVLEDHEPGPPDDIEAYASVLELARLFELQLGLQVHHGCRDDYLTLAERRPACPAHAADTAKYEKLKEAMQITIGQALEGEGGNQELSCDDLRYIVGVILERSWDTAAASLDLGGPLPEGRRLRLLENLASSLWPQFNPQSAAAEPSAAYPVVGPFPSEDVAQAIAKWAS